MQGNNYSYIFGHGTENLYFVICRLFDNIEYKWETLCNILNYVQSRHKSQDPSD